MFDGRKPASCLDCRDGCAYGRVDVAGKVAGARPRLPERNAVLNERSDRLFIDRRDDFYHLELSGDCIVVRHLLIAVSIMAGSWLGACCSLLLGGRCNLMTADL